MLRGNTQKYGAVVHLHADPGSCAAAGYRQHLQSEGPTGPRVSEDIANLSTVRPWGTLQDERSAERWVWVTWAHIWDLLSSGSAFWRWSPLLALVGNSSSHVTTSALPVAFILHLEPCSVLADGDFDVPCQARNSKVALMAYLSPTLPSPACLKHFHSLDLYFKLLDVFPSATSPQYLKTD